MITSHPTRTVTQQKRTETLEKHNLQPVPRPVLLKTRGSTIYSETLGFNH